MSKYSVLLYTLIHAPSSFDADDVFDIVGDLKVMDRLDDAQIESLSRIYAIIKNKFTQLVDSDAIFVEGYAAVMVNRELALEEPINPYELNSYSWLRWQKGRDAANGEGNKIFKFGPKPTMDANQ